MAPIRRLTVVVCLALLGLTGVAAATTAEEQAAIDAPLHALLPGATGQLSAPDASGATSLTITLPAAPPTTGAVALDTLWRASVIAPAAGRSIPSLTAVTVAGDSWFSRFRSPGADTRPQHLGEVDQALAKRQVDQNLDVLRAGLPATAIQSATVDTISLDTAPDSRSFVVSITVKVDDLSQLQDHFGDFLRGLPAGLGDGIDARTEGYAVQVSDAAGRTIGVWSAPETGSGFGYVEPGLNSQSALTPTLTFTSITGAPFVPASPAGPVYSVPPLPIATGTVAAHRWIRPRRVEGYVASRLHRSSRRVRIELVTPSCAGGLARVRVRRSPTMVVITTIYNVFPPNGAVISCAVPSHLVKTVSLHGRLGPRAVADGASRPPRVRYARR